MKVMKKKAAMKAMKVMKKKAAMKAMKVMKKKSVSKVAHGQMAKAMVLRGSKEKTVGGLTAKDLTKNKFGKIVSKKRSAFAFATAWIHGDFLAKADLFLLTILPYLFLVRSFAVKPPIVFSLLPRSTMALAIWPRAILLTDFFFIVFMAFMAAFFFITFIAFMAAFFFITFMAFMAAFFFITFMAFMAAIFFITFMAFIALAIVMRRVVRDAYDNRLQRQCQ